RKHPENLFTAVLAAERSTGTRVVAANEHWTAFVPAVARWPFEVHVYPHRRVPDIPALNSDERDAFGPLYLEVLRRLDGMFGLPSRPGASASAGSASSAAAPGSQRGASAGSASSAAAPGMPYISAWYQAPVRADRDLAYLHLQLFSTRRAPGKLKHLAGSESAMGVFVNDVRPEQAAAMLREVAL